MRNALLCFLSVLLLFGTFAFTQDNKKPAEPTMPYTPSLDPQAMDKSADPCVDFYRYSCGGWQTRNPIPADQISWSVYGKLYQDNLNFLRGILEETAQSGGEREGLRPAGGGIFFPFVGGDTGRKGGPRGLCGGR